MGLCASKPIVQYGQVHAQDCKTIIAAAADNAEVSKDSTCPEQMQKTIRRLSQPVVSDKDKQSIINTVKDTCQPSSPPSSSEMILEVKKLLQDLADPKPGSLCINCGQAAMAVRNHLKGVAHVGIMLLTSSPTACMIPGLEGAAYELLQHRRVMINTNWAAAFASRSTACNGSIGGSAQSIYYSVPAPPRLQNHLQHVVAKPAEARSQQLLQQDEPQEYMQQVGDIATKHWRPDHWSDMHDKLGMQTFLAVPVSDAAGGLVGVLELASMQQDAFLEEWWDPVLSIICSSLVPLLTCPSANCLRSLMGLLVETRHDFVTFATTCIQGVAALLETVTNLQLGVRLGFLSPDKQQVLLLHVDMPPPPPSKCDQDGEPTGETVTSSSYLISTACATGRLLAECKDTEGTLLAEAVAAGEPKCIPDTTAAYLEEESEKGDVFIGSCSHNTPNSIMAAPLLDPLSGDAYGGLYVTQSKRGNFSESMIAISCVVRALQLFFSQQLVTLPSDWVTFIQPTSSTMDVSPSSSDSLPRRNSRDSRRSSTDSKHDDSGGFLSGAWSRRNSSNLGNMVKAVQADVLQYLDSKKQYETDIQLLRVLGRGGFGTVYEGHWQGCRAAIKVTYVPENLRRLMKCALEMATMATISHPNIVRVYTCLTDMVEETGALLPGQVSSPRSIRFRPALPEDYSVAPEVSDTPQPAICNVMVMELCELGNLRRALEKGLLHKPLLESRRIVVDMEMLLEVLLDVARSIQHIHSLNMLHCDIKADNVLLKSNTSSTKQFVCKLADFGLMKVLQADKMYLRNMSISGTITHVAPERLEGDSQLTTAVDSYGFGMLMWEVYTCQAPFATLRPAEIVKKVYRGERPAFPPNTPGPYQQLAEACWAHDPTLRPSMDVIVQQLQIWRAHLAANSTAH